MEQIDLNGLWRLTGSGPGVGDAQGWHRTGVPAGQCIPARVPGDVHLDLLRAGRIAEPLFGRNALDCQWVEAYDWWYSRAVVVNDAFLDQADRVELHAAGLDLTAKIWLNGQNIGCHNNQFIPATFDVTDTIRPGENLLVARLDVGLRSAPNDRRRYVHITSLPPSGLPRMWMRKAQFSFGWDWAPRLLTCGIWRPVSLRAYRGLAIRDVFLSSHLENGAARLKVQMEVESFFSAATKARFSLLLHRTPTAGERPAHEGAIEVAQPVVASSHRRTLTLPFLHRGIAGRPGAGSLRDPVRNPRDSPGTGATAGRRGHLFHHPGERPARVL